MLIQAYKKTGSFGDLRLHIYLPNDNSKERKRVIVFFHGAGFTSNKVGPRQFHHHAEHFASRGMVAICAEYRPMQVAGLFSPIDCIANAKSAIRWIRSNSAELGVNSDQIIAAGASAGGYLCLICDMFEREFNDPADDVAVSGKPDALVIFNGGVDSAALIPLFPDSADALRVASPANRMTAGLSPCLFFHGTDDANIPIAAICDFVRRSTEAGNLARLSVFEGAGHGFFNYGNDENVPYLRTIREMDIWLEEALETRDA